VGEVERDPRPVTDGGRVDDLVEIVPQKLGPQGRRQQCRNDHQKEHDLQPPSTGDERRYSCQTFRHPIYCRSIEGRAEIQTSLLTHHGHRPLHALKTSGPQDLKTSRPYNQMMSCPPRFSRHKGIVP
jgi:hypothetical protein